MLYGKKRLKALIASAACLGWLSVANASDMMVDTTDEEVNAPHFVVQVQPVEFFYDYATVTDPVRVSGNSKDCKVRLEMYGLQRGIPSPAGNLVGHTLPGSTCFGRIIKRGLALGYTSHERVADKDVLNEKVHVFVIEWDRRSTGVPDDYYQPRR